MPETTQDVRLPLGTVSTFKVVTSGAEGPWKDGDLLHVTPSRESGAVIVESPEGSWVGWGAHHLPTFVREVLAGHVIPTNERGQVDVEALFRGQEVAHV